VQQLAALAVRVGAQVEVEGGRFRLRAQTQAALLLVQVALQGNHGRVGRHCAHPLAHDEPLVDELHRRGIPKAEHGLGRFV
jgi:hypothetical protein